MNQHRPDYSTLVTARALLYLAQDWHFGNLVSAQAADLYKRFLYAYSPREIARLAYLKSPVVRQLIGALEYITVPGIALLIAVRKVAIEQLVRAGIEAGARQVVLLAPGFDTLAPRLHREFPQVRFIEVDRPINQEVKRRALMGVWAPGPNLGFVSADVVRESFDDKLLNSIYVEGQPTLFVAEGLLTWMTRAERDALFDFVAMAGGPDSSVVFTFMERGPDGRIFYHGASRLARWWWRLRGARFQWGPNQVELEEYLGKHGLRLSEMLTAREFRAHHLDGNPDVLLAEGEDVALARVVRRRSRSRGGTASSRSA